MRGVPRAPLRRAHADLPSRARPRGVPLRQASEQYFTASQSRSHFLRQANGRWQTGQVLDGRGVAGMRTG
jgi:hypothetical protein